MGVVYPLGVTDTQKEEALVRQRHCFRHGHADCGCEARNLPRLIEPAVLLLLKEQGSSHGYDLASKVNAEGLSQYPVEPGAIYRCLRQLEAQGCVQSEWDTSGSGPAKRGYVLTDEGDMLLRGWAEVLARRGEAMVRFAKRCSRPTGGVPG
ncbi:MAG: PadR family transcriptional regulator [Armatimonadetes bacterium CG_4_10_14_0_8_um_filter_66_14]|nr:MAG: PadR family transcriptional regulator [Armatimonadetes bacterium CG_4_10_14_0_8_um_filter_66_14]